MVCSTTKPAIFLPISSHTFKRYCAIRPLFTALIFLELSFSYNYLWRFSLLFQEQSAFYMSFVKPKPK